MPSVPSCEVYPHAPLVLVAAEVRHPDATPLTDRQHQQLRNLLSHSLPLSRPLLGAPGMIASIAPGADPQMTPIPATTLPRYMSRDLFTSVTFHRDAVVVETTRYQGFEHLFALVRHVLEARLAVGPLDGVDRVGLRYIDEIRTPGAGEPGAWGQWIHPSLLGPENLSGELHLSNDAWQGIAAYSGSLPGSAPFDQMSVVLRYGVGDGYAVAPSGDLRRDTPPPGPFFLIDIDSFWGARDGVPPLDLDTLAATLEGLHAPVRALFENAITDRLRNEVLRHHDS